MYSRFFYALKQKQSILKRSPAWQRAHLWRRCSAQLLSVAGTLYYIAMLWQTLWVFVRSSIQFSSPAHGFYAVNGITFRHIPPGASYGRLVRKHCQVSQTPVKIYNGRNVFIVRVYHNHARWIISKLEAPHANSSNPSDLAPLTTGHFMIGRSLVAPPEPLNYQSNINIVNHWKFVQLWFFNSIAAMAKGMFLHASSSQEMKDIDVFRTSKHSMPRRRSSTQIRELFHYETADRRFAGDQQGTEIGHSTVSTNAYPKHTFLRVQFTYPFFSFFPLRTSPIIFTTCPMPPCTRLT